MFLDAFLFMLLSLLAGAICIGGYFVYLQFDVERLRSGKKRAILGTEKDVAEHDRLVAQHQLGMKLQVLTQPALEAGEPQSAADEHTAILAQREAEKKIGSVRAKLDGASDEQLESDEYKEPPRSIDEAHEHWQMTKKAVLMDVEEV